MRDEQFIRGKVPMTKSEIRAISLSKLELQPDSVLYDIGAGTGSVSVEAALKLPLGHVYAIEQKEDACHLIEENRNKFLLTNMTIVHGKAPEAMAGLPTPTHVFIGGSEGQLAEILSSVFAQQPQVRVVINCIALETLSQVVNYLNNEQIDAEYISVQIAKGHAVGSYHMMKGENPIYVISFGGVKTDDTLSKPDHDCRTSQ